MDRKIAELVKRLRLGTVNVNVDSLCNKAADALLAAYAGHGHLPKIVQQAIAQETAAAQINQKTTLDKLANPENGLGTASAAATEVVTPRNLCNCPNCQTDNCPAGEELAAELAEHEMTEHTLILERNQAREEFSAAREEIGLLIATLDNRNKTIEYMQARLAALVDLPPEPVMLANYQISDTDIVYLKADYDALRSAAEAQIRALKAEVAALKHDIARHIQICADQANELEMRDDPDLLPDVKRYRWLRESFPERQQEILHSCGKPMPHRIDDAIDAVLARKD